MIIDKEASASIGRMLGTAFRIGKKKGVGGAVEYLRKFKDPTQNLPLGKGNIPQKIKTHWMQGDAKGKDLLSRGVRTSIGNVADNVAILGKDIKGKSIIKGTSQAAKNVGELAGRQLKGDLYKEVPKSTAALSRKGDDLYLKSKVPFLKDRKVVSQTGRDSVIVRKRKALTPASLALGGSGVSIGGVSYALSDKEKPQKERIQRALTDTALYGVGIPVGIASEFFRGDEQSKIKKKTKK